MYKLITMKQYSIKLIPEGLTKTFDEDTLLVDALTDMGVVLRTSCGGKGICGKCMVKAQGGLSERTDQEKRVLEGKPDYRLACQARLKGDVSVFHDRIDFITHKAYPLLDPNKAYSIAVDIGTTSVQLSLVDLSQKRSYEIGAFLNPQRRFGDDVITRIAASSKPRAFGQIVHCIREEIFSTITQALKEMSLPLNRIEKIVFSGNTTMLHFLFGLDVSSMGVYPYEVNRLDFDDFTPADIEADMLSHSQICAIPARGAFLGGDLVGGLCLCYEDGFKANTFFIDLGTNGELFLINKADEIFATSCAMGPALEGMNISSGMTADVGAITHVRAESDSLQYQMINSGTPVGITGTALIDIVSIFLKRNIIMGSGAFARDIDRIPLLVPAIYEATKDARQVNLWGDIALTQKDIRSLQLAKGASLAASRFLLKESGCTSRDVERVLIAGAFGEHLDIDHFKRLKFIPEFSNASYHFLGNTSLKAAQSACLDQGFLKKASDLRDRIHVIELSMNPDFYEEFMSAMEF